MSDTEDKPADVPEKRKMSVDKVVRFVDGTIRVVMAGMYLLGMLMWALVGLPFWLIGLCLALCVILFMTFARAMTSRNYSIDRLFLRNVIRFYPEGFRLLKMEFSRADEQVDEDNLALREVSYTFSTAQTIVFIAIIIIVWLTYRGVDLLLIPPNVLVASLLVIALALGLAFFADRAKYASKERAAQAEKHEESSPN